MGSTSSICATQCCQLEGAIVAGIFKKVPSWILWTLWILPESSKLLNPALASYVSIFSSTTLEAYGALCLSVHLWPAHLPALVTWYSTPRTQHFRCSAWYRSFLKVVLFQLLGGTFQLFLSYKIIFDFTLPQLSVSAAIMWFPTSVIHEELNEGNVWLGNPFYRL